MENEVRLFPLMTAIPLGVTVESLQQRNSDFLCVCVYFCNSWSDL